VREFTLSTYAAYNVRIAAALPICIAAGLRAYVWLGRVTTQSIIGNEAKLLPLAASTIDEKSKLSGLAGRPEQPLLRFGGLRASYEEYGRGYTAGWGSEAETALWHHIGGPRYPPRPALTIAVNETRAEGFKMMKTAVGVAIGASVSLSRMPQVGRAVLARALTRR
jgi:hypothetical protein